MPLEIRSKRVALVIATALAAVFCRPALGQGPELPPLQSHGGQFTKLVPEEQAPEKPFLALDGSLRTLSQFRQHVLILNF